MVGQKNTNNSIMLSRLNHLDRRQAQTTHLVIVLGGCRRNDDVRLWLDKK